MSRIHPDGSTHVAVEYEIGSRFVWTVADVRSDASAPVAVEEPEAHLPLPEFEPEPPAEPSANPSV